MTGIDPGSTATGIRDTTTMRTTTGNYRASHDDYQESIFPNGVALRYRQDALDLACGLYLVNRIAWQDLKPPTK